jgi:hypothetical protein
MSLMAPLIQDPCIIPQLILSLCTISITTCNKLCEIRLLFNGDKITPRLWLFHEQTSFEMAFSDKKPRKISEALSCIAASGDKMSSMSVFEVNL